MDDRDREEEIRAIQALADRLAARRAAIPAPAAPVARTGPGAGRRAARLVVGGLACAVRLALWGIVALALSAVVLEAAAVGLVPPGPLVRAAEWAWLTLRQWGVPIP